ncbi:CRISPR-associated DxTHG motif protein [Methylotuvimicrobium buryatense]|uniref:CRISPR-associated DxTHG motif protein n=1 Tax=Methylotuvimicrobium buryatense TaxID=95641 RepID=A0A4P9USZ7_METBY|nr:CRISPR-associated DxTHG motif protein [Methylotuvimicrobium buryatense]
MFRIIGDPKLLIDITHGIRSINLPQSFNL